MKPYVCKGQLRIIKQGDKMKRWLFASLLLSLTLSLYGCNSSKDDNTDEEIIDIIDLKWGITESIDLAQGSNLSSLRHQATLNTGVEYFVVYDFKVSGRVDSKKERWISSELNFTNAYIVDAFTQESWGTESSIPIGQDSGEIWTDSWKVRVPHEAERSVPVRLIIQLEPQLAGRSDWHFEFTQSSETSEGLTLRFDNTRGSPRFVVNFVTSRILSPEINIDYPSNSLVWIHRPHTKYYEIFIDDEFYRNYDTRAFDEGVILMQPLTNVDPGSKIRIRAISNNALFSDSNYSNEVTYD